MAAGIDYPKTLSIVMVAGRWFVPAADHGLRRLRARPERRRERSSPASATSRALVGAAAFDATAVLGRRLTLSGRADRVTTVVGVLEDPMTYRRIFESFDEGRSSRTLVGSLLSFRNVYVPADAMPTDDLAVVKVVPDPRHVREEATRLRELAWACDVLDAIAATPRPSPCSCAGTGWTRSAGPPRARPSSGTSSGSSSCSWPA